MPEIVIKREPADPMLPLRASIGGSKELGYYLVWRSDDPKAIVEMLKTVTKAAEKELPKFQRPMG